MSLGVDLDGEVRRVDPDRWLASRFIADRERRADVIALYAFDHELARAETAASNPLASEIRLVWWGEAVAEMVAGEPRRRHPVADALAAVIRKHELPVSSFETMIEARISALGAQSLAVDAALSWSWAAQGNVAGLAARILGAGDSASNAEPAGTVWGLQLLRRAKRAAGLERLEIQTLSEARKSARKLPTAAFPAALVSTLARADTPSGLETRARLAWAAVTGKI